VLEPGPNPAISVVVPVYRNIETLQELFRRLARVFERRTLSFQVIFVDDCSPDGSFDSLTSMAADDPRVVVVRLRANVGQHAAVLQGILVADGTRVVIMDADLQDQPESIPELMAPTGYGAVFAGRRGRYESRARLLTSQLFKRLLGRLAGVPADAGMFVLITREMVDRLLAMPRHNPYVVAMIGCSGLPVTSIPIERDVRPHGRSAYSVRARARSAWRGVRWTIAWRTGISRRMERADAMEPQVSSVIGGRFNGTGATR
jgi:glycosyltransferase involved in cell wall biosynthesis